MAFLPPFTSGGAGQWMTHARKNRALFSNGNVKSSGGEAPESRRRKRTFRCATMGKDEGQRSKWTFYEAVKDVQ